MSAGTKVALIVLVLIVAIPAVYYGFSGGSPSTAEVDSTDADAELPVRDPMDSQTPPVTQRPELRPTQSTPQPDRFAARPEGTGISGGVMPEPATSTRQPDIVPVTPGNAVQPDAAQRLAAQFPTWLRTDPEGHVGGKDLPPSADQPSDPRTLIDPAMPANSRDEVVTPPLANSPVSLPRGDEPAYGEYVVKDYDSLWTIAESWFGNGSKWNLIQAANPGIDPDRLQVGKKLRMPPKDAVEASAPAAAVASSAAPAPTSAPARTSGQVIHTVKAKDTLRRLAQLHFNDPEKWNLIYEANKTAIGPSPDRLVVGMQLRIPVIARSGR